jgi:hypothetical protein
MWRWWNALRLEEKDLMSRRKEAAKDKIVDRL